MEQRSKEGSGNHGNPLSGRFDFADLSALGGPRFILTVDTEEEFDWGGGFSREGYGTTHLKAVPRFQEMCDDAGIRPVYMVDYPITQDIFGADMLACYAEAGRAEIGVQLHPWVNPPHDEILSVSNSFACNLPPDLERAKLSQLHAAIVSKMGVRPDCYRAGRYGAGSNTPQILQDLGIAIDTSVRARFDYSGEGGPNYAQHPVNPYWLAPGLLLELPVTTVFGGAMRAAGTVMFGRVFESQTARSVLARSKMLERIALTPEGIPVQKALQGVDLALREGVKVINLSFHSPSLAVGHTPYVRSAEQLAKFYDWFSMVFAHLEKNGVKPVTMARIKIAANLNSAA